ncbi:MAG: GGDEF domain-containing protein [Spirochaetota bacterium]|nr:GGDEF domain-containing protein [Spirochaetota bacterium]
MHVWEHHNTITDKWYQLRDQAILWVDGRLVRLEVATDITELKKLEEQLKHLSYFDALTEIGNRRSFDQAFETEWRRALRNGSPISLIMIDIDFFKRYNDSYGHQAGDECLKKISKAIHNSLNRPGDIVARYGGEEFVVILSLTDRDGAAVIAENIRAEIEDMKIEHRESSVSKHVTISLGTATTTPKQESESSELIYQADTALYRAKENGRNQVCVAMA